MRKTLITLLVIIASVLGYTSFAWGDEEYVPPKTPPLTESAALTDDNKYLDLNNFGTNYFVSYNPALKLELNMEKYPEFNNTHLLFYGGPHGDKGSNGEYRYTGINDVGENLPNIEYPNDVTPAHQYLEQNNWLPSPWLRTDVAAWMSERNETIYYNPKLDGKSELRKNIWWGLKYMHPDEFRGDENMAWENYVHVLQPPTFWGWGWGRAWHKENGVILYRSIPIAPQAIFIKWIPNLYVKNFYPGSPLEQDETGKYVYTAEPFTTYTGTVTFGIESENEWLKVLNVPTYLGFVHQIKDSNYYGTLLYQSGKGTITGPVSAYPLAPAGMKFQTIKFNDDNSEITATFQWTAQVDTKRLTVGINSWPGLKYLYEGDIGLEYADNVATIPITVKPLPDAYAQSISPGTDRPEPEKEYHGTVTYGLMNTFPGPVECKLGLTHNGYPVPDVDGKIVTFNPGETKSFPFVWHGQQVGQNSTLVAKIWPQKPTVKDINWANNTKTVVVYNAADLSVTNLNPGSTAYYVNNTYNGSVVVRNNMATTVNNVVVKFFKGKAEIPGTRRTISSLGPNASTTVSFTWKAPSAKGQINIVAKVNPDRVIPENNYDNNTVSVPVYINDGTVEQDGGQLHISATVTPSKVRAGEGFSISVSTRTDEYIWYETETYIGSDGKIHTRTVRKTRPCPGPQKVTAYFPDGNSVEMERSTPGRPTSNTWQLPPNPNSPQNLRKKYIASETPDGNFITKIVAEGAGDSGEFTAKTSVTVIVEGSIYDDVGSRITQ